MIRGSSSGNWRRISSNLSQVSRFPRVRRPSHSFQMPSASGNTSASRHNKISGLILTALLPCCLRFDTHQSPGEWQDSLLTCLLDFESGGICTRWMTIRGFANSPSVPLLPSFFRTRSRNYFSVIPCSVIPTGAKRSGGTLCFLMSAVPGRNVKNLKGT